MHRPALPSVVALVTLAAGFAGTSSAPARAEDPPIGIAIARAVDLPDPAARTKEAKVIAARPDATVARLVEAMTHFGVFAKHEPGPHTVTAALWDGVSATETDISYHVPAGYDPAKPAPALLALHGAGGSGESEHVRWMRESEALGMIVIAPTDPGANAGYGYTEGERAVQMSALRWARRRFNIDENRVFLTGISRGGHLAWDLAIRHPDVFAGIAPMIGGPRLGNQRGENNLRFLENLRRMPIRDLQGDGDDPLLVANLRLAFERLDTWDAPDAKLLLQPGRGHDFDFAAVDWMAWFSGLRRDPSPAEVLRRGLAPGARSHWVEILGVGRGATPQFRPQVDAKTWGAASETEKRRIMLESGEKATARVEVKRTAPGTFEAVTSEVTSFRLLLANGSFDAAKPVVVKLRGRTVSAAVKPDARVLVAEFVERFDRTFLPVAEFVVR